MITRNKALEKVNMEVKTKNLIKHMLAVEVCMRALAHRLGQDEELWGLTGLLHDLDYEYTKDTPQEHAQMTCRMLGDDLPPESLSAILAHNQHKPCESQLEIALCAVDPTSGFLVSCALMHPDKRLASLDVEFIKNRMKEKRFSAAVSREQMTECEKLGVGLDEFLELCLRAMQGISKELGL